MPPKSSITCKSLSNSFYFLGFIYELDLTSKQNYDFITSNEINV